MRWIALVTLAGILFVVCSPLAGSPAAPAVPDPVSAFATPDTAAIVGATLPSTFRLLRPSHYAAPFVAAALAVWLQVAVSPATAWRWMPRLWMSRVSRRLSFLQVYLH